MQTTTHIVANLAILGGLAGWRYPWAMILGGLLPDFMMFVFFFVERFLFGTVGSKIWDEAYWHPLWQMIFDIPNSLPLILIVAGVAIWKKKEWLWWLTAGMGLHAFVDFFVHNDDAHRHFLPFSDYRFESPVSYWDPAHYGNITSALEVVLLVLLSIYAWHKWDSRAAKITIAIALLFTVGIRIVFAFIN